MNSTTEILPLKTFLAVEDAIQFLRQNAHVQGLFRCERGSYIKHRIFNALKRGDRHALHHLLHPSTDDLARTAVFAEVGFATAESQIAVECSSALISLLVNMPKPLFPLRVQRLVLDGNEGIPEEDVARDALGLLRQELGGRHLALASSFLNLLCTVSKNALYSELGGPSIAASLLPAFFHLQAGDVNGWQRSAAIFSDLIAMVPRFLGPQQLVASGESGDSFSLGIHNTSSAESHGTQGPTNDVGLPGYRNITRPRGRRRPRRRSPRRCALMQYGGPEIPRLIWRNLPQGLLHPVLAGLHQ